MGDQQLSTNGHDQTEKLEEFLSCLEEERLKIDAFKRELPLCMQLLTNAMETSRQQLQTYRENKSSPVLEEFIPMNNSNGSGPEKAPNPCIDNKANWMTSAQLWSQAGSTISATNAVSDHVTTQNNNNNNATLIVQNETDINFNAKQRNGGAFHPFSKERNSSCSNPAVVLPELALSSGEKDVDHEENKSCVRENSSIKGGNGEVNDNPTTANTATASGTATSSQTHRKTRRCWSPDLHRRFVNALQMLGGSQVATPKQIRELMKVDGLTNDEVKSHLQKYRLHTRRPSTSPQAAGTATPQLVVLGGIWVPPEYATAAGAQTLYTNPHYGTPQEFYSTAVLPPPHHHHPAAAGNHHHQLNHHNIHMYKPSSQATQSLQASGSGGRGGGTTTAGGNRSESIEDGKSESGGSWKAESGGDTKALMLREECDQESNGSEITLKF
ncbi:hypothetical protein M8C21_033354 [Ambrosia artemisiifolia]|uniref:HTH myb-type domain-containing protein n=1 Tax=Ambrosia artemisiifolia TaxID=4212 RepID=A0AAD5CLA1_AMBAR|nr:hypothetical protein M8C21_033354 [Ambrosia artemisiifolia]